MRMTKQAAIFVIWSLHFFIFGVCYNDFNGCELRRDPNYGFIVKKNFGFKKILLSTEKINIKLDADEVVEAYCEKEFSDCSTKLGIKIQIHCMSNGQLAYRKNGMEKPIPFGCSDFRCPRSGGLDLYESKQKLSNCKDEGYTSLALGVRANPAISEIYAGICYDWKNLEVKSVKFMAYKEQNMIIQNMDSSHEKENEKFIEATMDKKISNYDTLFKFMSEGRFTNSYKALQKTHSLLEYFDFDYTSLIQDRPLSTVLKPYTDILNIPWWRNLRLGNWQLFHNLLEERTATVKYSSTTGIMGTVVMPNVANPCNANVTLTIETEENNMKKTAPAYVWMYLTSLKQNTTDDFVVIGFNSPFYSHEKSSEIIFCHDICHEIDWLHRLGRVRLMPTMGLIFCCRPKEAALKLENFPSVEGENAKHLSITKKVKSTSPKPLTTSATPPSYNEYVNGVLPEYID